MCASRVAKLAIACLALSGCASHAYRVDDQEGQSGQGKDRIEALRCEESDALCSLTVDLGRDKDRVELDAARRVDGSWVLRYRVGRAAGADQADVRARLEAAIAIEQNTVVRQALERLREIFPEGVQP